MRGQGAPRDRQHMHGIHVQWAPRDRSGWPTRGDVAGGCREDGHVACRDPRIGVQEVAFQGRIAGAELDRRGAPGGMLKGCGPCGIACRLQRDTSSPVVSRAYGRVGTRQDIP